MTDLHDDVAEQIWGVLVAAEEEGVTDPILVAHAAAHNVLALPELAQLKERN